MKQTVSVYVAMTTVSIEYTKCNLVVLSIHNMFNIHLSVEVYLNIIISGAISGDTVNEVVEYINYQWESQSFPIRQTERLYDRRKKSLKR